MKFPKNSTIGLLALAGVALLLSSYCGPASTATPVPTPTPLPTSMPVKELYQFYQDELARNPTRVETYKNAERSSVFEGPITNITGSTVQFHIKEVYGGPDKYIECKFRRDSQVVSLSAGSVAKLLGDLEDVNGVVQFKNCSIVR